MKPLFQALFLLGAATAVQAAIIITLDNPNQIASGGQTLSFFGTIFNNGTDTVFLNSDSFNLALDPASYSFSDNFGSVPISLEGGTDSGDIDLFDITLNDPIAANIYPGNYTLQGGVDENAGDNLAQVDLSIDTNPVETDLPEPSGWILAAGGLLGVALYKRRLLRCRHQPQVASIFEPC